jgi:hypothetical protein
MAEYLPINYKLITEVRDLIVSPEYPYLLLLLATIGGPAVTTTILSG